MFLLYHVGLYHAYFSVRCCLKENHHAAIIPKKVWLEVQRLLSVRHTGKSNAPRRSLAGHFTVSRVKSGIFQGYFILDARWPAAARGEFMKTLGYPSQMDGERKV